MPTSQRVLVIHNPLAARGSAASRVADLVRALTDAGIRYDLEPTKSSGQGIVFAERGVREGYTAIVAAGGDGTVNEVINGVVLAKREDEAIPPVGIYPIGGGNDLAHALHLVADASALSRAIVARRSRRIDLGLASLRGESGEVRRYFHNSLGFGLEASVTQQSDHIRNLSGGLLYLMAAFRALRSYSTPLASIDWIDDAGQRRSLEQEITIVSIGNAKRTGGAFYLTPAARVDDGLFDVALAGSMSRARLLSLLPRALLGKHTGAKSVHMLRCRQISVRSQGALPVHLDGEVAMLDAVEASAVVDVGRLEILA